MITRIPIRSALSSTKAYTQYVPKCSKLQRIQRFALQSSYSTATPPTPATDSPKPIDLRSQFTQPPPPPPPEPAKRRSRFRFILYASLFTAFGLTAGQYMRLIIAPPALPLPDSREDLLMVEYLHKEASKLPLVSSLSEDPAWEFHDAYTSLSDSARSSRLTTGALGGARAIGGYQRVFVNKETGEQITVIWFGGAIAGWPGVTHGGLVATVMDEQLGRCAIRQFPSKTGVTANLELNYLKPIVTNSFYVIRSAPVLEGLTDRKAWIEGRLETVEGRVCVEAKALFVVPKKFKTATIADKF